MIYLIIRKQINKNNGEYIMNISNNNNLTKFKNEIIQKLNKTYNRYTLKDINNLFNNKSIDIEFFVVDDVYEIIDELFLKYIKNKEGI